MLPGPTPPDYAPNLLSALALLAGLTGCGVTHPAHSSRTVAVTALFGGLLTRQ